MYGFVETDIADILLDRNLIEPYEEFATTSGERVAMLEKEDFLLVKQILVRMCGEEKVQLLSSDVVGMYILLYPYWMHENLFDALTPGPVKESPLYLEIRTEPSTSRFNWDSFIISFKELLDIILTENEECDDIDEEESTEEDPTEEEQAVPPNFNPGYSFAKDFFKCYDLGFREIEIDNMQFLIHWNSNILNKTVTEIATRLKKNVIVLSGSWSSRTQGIERHKDALNHVLIIHTNPDHLKFLYPPMEMEHTLFGYELRKLAQIHGNSSDINHDPNNPHPISPVYSDFDYVYRDYKTGIVWALQKNMQIFFMFDLLDVSEDLRYIVLEELIDRFNGALSYEEMVKRDIEHFNMKSQYIKEEFLSMAIKNSNSLIEELKNQYLYAKEQYAEALDKAMEFGKVAQRLEENLVSLDEDKIKNKEAERCEKMFDDVLNIPKVAAIKLKGSAVHVYTKNIYVKHDKEGTWHDVGTFNIEIGMYGNTYNPSKTVKIFNTKHQMHAFNSQMQAPHVFDDGHLCHGNLTAGMIDAYKRRDLYQMILMIIMFLESANLDDAAGAYLPRWPEVSEEIATQPESDDNETTVVFQEQTEEEKEFDEILDIPIHI